MKLSIKTLLLLLAVAGFTVTACKDDEESASDKLTAASCWKNTKSETYDPTTNTWSEDALDDCDKDDCIRFQSGGTMTFDEGATKCDPTDPQTGTGTWSLSADGTTLTVTDNTSGFSFVGKITEISNSKLVIEIEPLPGFKGRLTFTN